MNAGGVLVYVLGLVWLFSIAGKIFSKQDSLLMPAVMLLTFIISASITGLLVLGKPILLYLDGLKKEACVLLFSTIGWLVLFLLIVILVIILG